MSFEKERFTPEEATKHVHSPRLAGLMAEYFKGSSRPLYDFGCGTGYYLSRIASNGVMRRCTGLEGTEFIKKKDYIHIMHPVDIVSRIHLGPKGDVISIEVGEHIAEDRLNGFLWNLNHHCDKRLVLTWAVRGQGGTRHVSCRDEHEVLDMIEPFGFEYKKDLSEAWREKAGKDLWWFKKSIYIFEREDKDE